MKQQAEISEDETETPPPTSPTYRAFMKLSPRSASTRALFKVLVGCVCTVERISVNSKVFPAIQSMFSDPGGIKFEILINNRKISRTCPNMWKLNNTWVKEEIKGEITQCFEQKDNKNTAYQNLEGVAKQYFKG